MVELEAMKYLEPKFTSALREMAEDYDCLAENQS